MVWVVRFLLLVILALVGYYVYLLYSIHGQNTTMTNTEQQIQADQQDLSKVSGRDELLTRQQQLKQLMSLVGGHAYWTRLFPALAQVTLNSANFLSIQTLPDGSLSMSGTVPSNEDLDKFLQVFDLPEFNKDFYDVKISSLGKAQVGNQLLVQFTVNMKYNPALLSK